VGYWVVRILALETSGTSGSVAVLTGDTLIIERPLAAGQRSAQSLAPAISQILAEVDWKPADVELVAVTRGPGSFTGLRVGVTTAKLFAYAVNAQVLGVNTLEVIAEQAPSEARRLTVVIDAQRHELFVGSFQRDAAGIWEPSGEATIEPVEQFLARSASAGLLSGPALIKLAGTLPVGASLAPREAWLPTASAIGRVAARRHARGECDDAMTLLPLYLRRSAAEEKWDER
jgi:tRNA threonylcarbamoyladenosine biosynthesis protein TsaB